MRVSSLSYRFELITTLSIVVISVIIVSIVTRIPGTVFRHENLFIHDFPSDAVNSRYQFGSSAIYLHRTKELQIRRGQVARKAVSAWPPDKFIFRTEAGIEFPWSESACVNWTNDEFPKGIEFLEYRLLWVTFNRCCKMDISGN